MQHIYLNTASCGLLPDTHTAAANQLNSAFASDASNHAEHWRDVEQPLVRQAVADFLQVQAANVALVPNFSWAMNGLVHSLRGDEKVLLYTSDYPSLTTPFKLNDFDITWINEKDDFLIDTTELKQLLVDNEIEILAISHVQWLSGFKIDLQDIAGFCREHDIWLIVDATQSMGAMPIYPAELDIDVFIASNYKWMNAGFGTAVMYMGNEFHTAYTPKVGGNNSFTMVDGKMQYLPSVQSYEPGHPNMFGFTILKSAIEHKLSLGLQHIEQHNRKLTELLLNSLTGLNVQLIGEASADNRASMVFLRDKGGLLQFIKERGVLVSGRMGHVRISMHYYNTEDDVMKLAEILRQL